MESQALSRIRRRELYDQLTPAQRDAARRLFLRLVTPGEGQADTRARSLIPEDPQQREIINLFASPKTRLLVTGYETLQGAARADITARATVEVAHEALIQRWPTLQAWVNDNREKLRDRAALLRFKAEWEENGQCEKFLLDPGVHLERGRALLANPGDVAVDDIRDYVTGSIERDQRRLNAERDKEDAQRQKELADQKRIADARKRTTQVAVAGLVVALFVAGFALWQYFKATEATRLAEVATVKAQASAKQADIAKKQALVERDRSVLAEHAANKARLEAQANAERARANEEQAKASLREAQTKQSLFLAAAARQQRATGDSGSAVLLAIEALLDDTPGAHRPNVPEAQLQLDGALRDLRERLVLSYDAALHGAAFSPDGKLIVVAFGRMARQWDVATGQPVGVSLRGHSSWVWSAAFSPDGKRVVTASADKTARIWDAETGQPVGTLIGHEAGVRRAAFSPDGKLIATASDDGTARLWEATGRPIGEPLRGHTDWVLRAAFSPDGKRVVTASRDGTARIWDATTGQSVGELKGHRGAVSSAAFSPDGQNIVTASYDGTVRMWSAVTGQPIGEPIGGHDTWVLSAAFSPDGKRLVTGYFDKTARLWDAATGQPMGELIGHNGPVSGAAFSSDGRRIVTASWDGTARVWDAANHLPIVELKGHENKLNSALFSSDDKRIVTASADGTARNLGRLSRHPGPGVTREGHRPALPHARAAQRLLPAPRAARMVHRVGEVALRHSRLETMAGRQARRQEPAAPRRAVKRALASLENVPARWERAMANGRGRLPEPPVFPPATSKDAAGPARLKVENV